METTEPMEPRCKLLDNTFSIFVQIALGGIALSSLIIKRKCFEKVNRPFIVWMIDISKQIAGQLFAHSLNIGIAYILSNSENQDECKWYLINYLLDTVIGVMICYLFVKLQGYLANKCSCPRIRSGNYMVYDLTCAQCLLQISIWLCIILLSKLILLGIILVPLHRYLGDFGDMVIHPLIGHPEVELVVVMIVVPLIMNVCQFWIQDVFLKDKVSEDRAPYTIADIDGMYFVHIDSGDDTSTDY